MVKLEKLIGPKCEGRVRPALIVAELDLEHTGPESLDYGANLAALQSGTGDVLQNCHDRQHFKVAHCLLSLR